jgi:hypothetical protein
VATFFMCVCWLWLFSLTSSRWAAAVTLSPCSLRLQLRRGLIARGDPIFYHHSLREKEKKRETGTSLRGHTSYSWSSVVYRETSLGPVDAFCDTNLSLSLFCCLLFFVFLFFCVCACSCSSNLLMRCDDNRVREAIPAGRNHNARDGNKSSTLRGCPQQRTLTPCRGGRTFSLPSFSWWATRCCCRPRL